MRIIKLQEILNSIKKIENIKENKVYIFTESFREELIAEILSNTELLNLYKELEKNL